MWTEKEVYCFCCNNKMRIEFGYNYELEEYDKIPMIDGGTRWETVGNYGTVYYDPAYEDNECLQLYICDECLEKRKHRVKHIGFETYERKKAIFAAPFMSEESERWTRNKQPPPEMKALIREVAPKALKAFEQYKRDHPNNLEPNGD